MEKLRASQEKLQSELDLKMEKSGRRSHIGRPLKYPGSKKLSYKALTEASDNHAPSSLITSRIPLNSVAIANLDLAQERIVEIDMAKLMERFERIKGGLEVFLEKKEYPHLHSAFKEVIDKIQFLEEDLHKYVKSPDNNNLAFLIPIGSQIEAVKQINFHYGLDYVEQAQSTMMVLTTIQKQLTKIKHQPYLGVISQQYNILYDQRTEIALEDTANFQNEPVYETLEELIKYNKNIVKNYIEADMIDITKLNYWLKNIKTEFRKFILRQKYPHLDFAFKDAINRITTLEESLAEYVIQHPTNDPALLIHIGSQLQNIGQINFHYGLTYLKAYVATTKLLRQILEEIKDHTTKVKNPLVREIFDKHYNFFCDQWEEVLQDTKNFQKKPVCGILEEIIDYTPNTITNYILLQDKRRNKKMLEE